MFAEEPFRVRKTREDLEELKSVYDDLAHAKGVLDRRANISLALEFHQLHTRVGALVDSAETEYHRAREKAVKKGDK